MKRFNWLCIVLMISVLAFAGCDSVERSGSSNDFNTDSVGEYGAGMAYEEGATEALTDDGGAEGGEYYDDNGISDYGVNAENKDSVTVEDAASVTSSGDSVSERKLITTIYISAETESFDELVGSVEREAASVGGYMESTSINSEYSYDQQGEPLSYGELVIRVPADSVDSFLNTVSEESNITQMTTNTDDITLSYVDTQSHLKALRTEEEALLSMLEKAETIEDIITVQSELTNVRYEIESFESQLRTMNNQIDYTTVNLNITEVKNYTPTEEKGYFEKISEGFIENLDGIGNWFRLVFAAILIFMPQILFTVVIILVVIFIIRHFAKKDRMMKDNNSKKEEKQNEKGKDSKN